jgi:raffinose/stachyose/melibiose transport system substrate-binding protein
VLPVRIRRVARPLLAATAAAVLVTGCSAGSIGGGSGDSSSGGGETTITVLYGVGTAGDTLFKALSDGFTAANPNIKLTLETQPTGTEGDNLTKTKLSTGEMADVFNYNSGSLFQALAPDTQLTPLTDQPWVSQLSDEMKPVVSTNNGTYGAPLGTTFGGGVLYNKKVYADLDLKVPTSWAEFDANNKKIKADGKVTPIEQSFGDTWTSQLFVLADFGNVAKQDPNWAADYTANKAKYANQPALQAFLNQQQTHDDGYYNKDFASTKYEDAVKAVATGKAAHYPMLTNALATIQQNNPDNINDVGFFPLPAQNAADTQMTLWLPNALYIPKTTEGAKLDAAKKFIAWVNSPEGCSIQTKASSVGGPFAISSCTLPDSVPQAVKDMQPYLDNKKVSPALEFLSPIKGPNLENLTVEVGSGISSGPKAAAQYDEDVKKQAQQLGLPGW